MNTHSTRPQMRLYGDGHTRLYINAAERARFMAAADKAAPMVASLALTLLYTGCRISEALALTPSSIQPEASLITFRTLKRRNPQVYREVPVPNILLKRLETVHDFTAGSDVALWSYDGAAVNRITAYRWIKQLMKEAGIEGAQASPKGLRHGYGIHALQAGIPLNLLQKWMGHADMKTTAIYANASGTEELEIAERMWGGGSDF